MDERYESFDYEYLLCGSEAPVWIAWLLYSMFKLFGQGGEALAPYNRAWLVTNAGLTCGMPERQAPSSDVCHTYGDQFIAEYGYGATIAHSLGIFECFAKRATLATNHRQANSLTLKMNSKKTLFRYHQQGEQNPQFTRSI